MSAMANATFPLITFRGVDEQVWWARRLSKDVTRVISDWFLDQEDFYK